MELNKIRLILNNDGTMNTQYSNLAVVINQYATNYILEVAYLNDIKTTRKMKIVFNIKGVSQPAKILSPTLERLKLEDAPEFYSYYSYTFRFTQYETQYYQDTLNATLYIYDESETVISNINLSFTMNKAAYNKLTPVNLESDSSLDSVVKALYNLRAGIIASIYSKSDADKKFAFKTELPDLSPYYTKIETEEVINESISRVIDGAPEAFDTLKEIYDFINNNRNEITDILAALNNKADKSAVYTKNEINTKLDNINYNINKKQDTLVSRVNIKTINNMDILGSGNLEIRCDLSHLETKTDALTKYNNAIRYTDNRIANLLDLAPSDFDTLKEIADYILSDKDFAQGVLNDISSIRGSITNLSSTLGGDISAVSNRVTSLENLNIENKFTSIDNSINTINTNLENKADKDNVYTKDEIDSTLGNIEEFLRFLNEGRITE